MMAVMRSTLACAVFSLIVGLASAFYEENGAVRMLDLQNFDEAVTTSRQTWVVEFYAPWCGHCKNLAPEYKQVAEDMYGVVNFGAVDATAPENAKLAQRFQINGYPSIKVFSSPAIKNPYTGKTDRMAIDYTGRATAKSLKRFAKSNMLSDVIKEEDGNHGDLVKNAFESGLSVITVFTERSSTAPLLKGLSTEFHDRLVVVEVPSTSTTTVETYGISSFPSIIAIQSSNEAETGWISTAFTGDMKEREALKEFFSTFAKDVPVNSNELSEEKEEITSELTTESWSKLVDQGTEGWIIGFSGKDSVSDWKDAETACDKLGLIKCGHVNCEVETELCNKYGKNLATEPKIMSIPYDSEKREGPMWKTVDLALDEVEDFPNSIRLLNSNAMQAFLAESYQSNKLPLILLTKKSSTPPLLKAVAHKLSDDVEIGQFPNPDQSLKDQFQVKKLPALVAMLPTPQGAPDENGEQSIQYKVINYNPETFGPIKYKSVVGFANLILQQVMPNKEKSASEDTVLEAVEEETGEIQEMTFSTYDRLCLKKGLCVIGMLNSQSEKFEDDLAVINTARSDSRKRKDVLFSFSWVNAKCQTQFADTFDVQEDKLPTVIAYSPKKNRYAAYIGAFAADDILTFLTGVKSGRIGTRPLHQQPEMADVDCQELLNNIETFEVEEDDFDMGDMMAEILAEEAAAAQALEEAAQKKIEDARLAEEQAKKDAAAAKKKKKKKKKKKSKSEL